MEICGKWVEKGSTNLWYVLYRISLISFAKCNLISLRNTRTMFGEAALSRYGDMWKLSGKGLYLFTMHFLSDFFDLFCKMRSN